MARGSMSAGNAVDIFCVSMESRRRTAQTVGHPIMAVFASTTGKEADAKSAKEQAFVSMETNGTSASFVGQKKKNHNYNGDKSYLKHIYFK
jgi:hypothetical protein